MPHFLGLEKMFKRIPLLAQKCVETVNQYIENDHETKLKNDTASQTSVISNYISQLYISNYISAIIYIYLR